jgi:hypothetical protein
MALLVTAAVISSCGSGDTTGHNSPSSSSVVAYPKTTSSGAPASAPVIPEPASTGSNRRLAVLAAARAIKHFPVPPGSTRLDTPPPHARHLRRLRVFSYPVDPSLTRTQWWLVPRRYDALVAWYAANTPADRDTTSYHSGGKSVPEAELYWRVHDTSKAYSPPTEVVSYARLGPELTAIRTDVTLAARADRTSKTLVPDNVTSMLISRHAIDGPDTAPKTVTVTDQNFIFAVIDAFDRVRGAYVPAGGSACGSPDRLVYRYSVTFHWPGHTLLVEAGEPLCELGRRLSLDGVQLPEPLEEGHAFVKALRAAFEAA